MTRFDQLVEQMREAYRLGCEGIPLDREGNPMYLRHTKRERAAWFLGYWQWQQGIV